MNLAAHVHASIANEGHEFDGQFALLLLIADVLVAAAFVPTASL